VLQEEGFDVTYLPVKPSGLIDIEDLKKAIRPDTSLVSIMTVNNEIGVIQPVKEIGRICKENKIFFHVCNFIRLTEYRLMAHRHLGKYQSMLMR
jgi:cysteine desulfurase